MTKAKKRPNCFKSDKCCQDIERILMHAFNPSFLEVIDESHKHAGHAGASQGGHYQVTIVSEAFEGKKLLESHRMVYQALEPVKSSIHALGIYVKSIIPPP